MRQKYNFIGASMHKDADERLVPQGKYIDANNIRIVNGDGGDAGVVKKYKGTTAIETFSSSEATLGMLEHKRVLYIFVLNESTGNTELYKYDIASDTKTLLMSMDLGNEASDAPFDMNIVDDEDVQGAEKILLYWNDRRNEPQKVNISELEADDTYYISSDIRVIKPSSLHPPTIFGGISGEINNIKDKNFQFAYRWIYEDGEVSPLTPFSGTDIDKVDYEYDNGQILAIVHDDGTTLSYKYSTVGFGSLSSEYLISTSLSSFIAYDTSELSPITGGLYGMWLYDDGAVKLTIGTGDTILAPSPSDSVFTEPSGDTWLDVLMSRDGRHAFVYGYFDNGGTLYPYIRKKNGNSMSEFMYDTSLSDAYTNGMAISEDGQKIYYITRYGAAVDSTKNKLHYSSDGGTNFNEVIEFSGGDAMLPMAVGCSANGNTVVVAGTVTRLSLTETDVIFYVSNDSATTITKRHKITVYGVTADTLRGRIYVSDDGRRIYVYISRKFTVGPYTGDYQNMLFASSDFGNTFEELTPTGFNSDSTSLSASQILDVGVSTYGDRITYIHNQATYLSTDYGESFIGNAYADSVLSTYPSVEIILGRDYIENGLNYIDVTVETGDKHVSDIEIYARERVNGNFMRIKSYDKDRDSISNDTTETFRFKNDGIYQVLSEQQKDRLFDMVPQSATSQTLAENRMIWASPRIGRSLIDASGYKIDADVTITVDKTEYSQSNYKTLKSGTRQSYGLLYKDSGGRPYSILPIGDVAIPYWHENVSEQVFLSEIEISHFAPPDAATVSVVRKAPKFDYDVIYRFEQVEVRNNRIYFLLPPDVNAEVGYTLAHAGDGISFSEISETFPIVEVVENSDQSLRLNLDEGKWIAINNPSTDGFSISNVLSNSSEYLSGCFYVQKQLSTEGDIVYYETPYVFDIEYDAVNDVYLHKGTVDQTFATPATITLSEDYDTIIKKYPYREEYKLSNLINISTLGRGWLESEDINEVTKYASLVWSDVYVSDTNYNGLSNVSPLNIKNLPTKHGTINKIHYNYSDLFVLQDDIASIIPVNKNILFGADGGTQLRESSNVLGTFNPIKSLHGCTSPESFSYWGEWIFYADKRRGKVMLVSGDSLSIVSDMGMNNYFRDALLGETGKIYSCYNPQTKCFMLGLPSKGKTAIFRPDVGFVCFQDIILGVAQNDKYYSYSVNGFTLFSHDTNNTLNYLYGSQKNASITLSANQESSIIKMWLAVMQETSSPWDLTLINTEQTTTIDSWEKRELFYFSEMPMAISSASSDTTMATEGVGLTQSVSGNDITIQNKIPRVVYVGDALWSLIDGTETEVGEIAAINGNIVSILALLNTPALGDFCYIRKNNYIDGDVIRDYYAKVTLTHDGDGETELYAINFEVKESKQ